MPFGLVNAPATFQEMMDTLFDGKDKEYVLPYLVDIIIFSPDLETHKIHLEKVLLKIKAAGIVLNQNKCKLFRREIKILGNIIKQNIIKPDPEKLEAINNYKQPNTIKELRSFLGLVNQTRHFIKNFANQLLH